LGGDVGVDRAGIHHIGVTPPVGDDVPAVAPGHCGGHPGVGHAPGDVVDDAHPGVQGGLGHGGAHGVHTHRHAGVDHRPGHGHHPLQFLGLADALCPGTGGLAAHIDDVGALVQQRAAVGDGDVGLEPLTAVAEGIGGHVHD